MLAETNKINLFPQKFMTPIFILLTSLDKALSMVMFHLKIGVTLELLIWVALIHHKLMIQSIISNNSWVINWNMMFILKIMKIKWYDIYFQKQKFIKMKIWIVQMVFNCPNPFSMQLLILNSKLKFKNCIRIFENQEIKNLELL